MISPYAAQVGLPSHTRKSQCEPGLSECEMHAMPVTKVAQIKSAMEAEKMSFQANAKQYHT